MRKSYKLLKDAKDVYERHHKGNSTLYHMLVLYEEQLEKLHQIWDIIQSIKNENQFKVENEFQKPSFQKASKYDEIIKLIDNSCKYLEKLPNVYKGKGEESLRDHIISVIGTNCVGSVTGETYNFKGKTDILIRDRDNISNIFIGECKIWKGSVSLNKAISQLLSYLSWRDDQAALIFFVKNKNFTNIINGIPSIIEKHPNYIEFNKTVSESWNCYSFSSNTDQHKKIDVSILCYHFPENS